MNKTISINISGFVFNIEEVAYEKLSQYLKGIKHNFTDEDEREEIMADIEARIAELFREKISDSKEVIVDQDVEDVIAIMGKPEDYLDEDEISDADEKTAEEEYANYKEGSRQADKKLFRDEETAMLGGVCSGLGHYFNMDPTLVRIIFILLTILGGSGILIYLILLFVVPEAKTTADKLQMQGRSVTLESIKRHAREIRDEVRENVKGGKLKGKFQKTVKRGAKAGSNFVYAFSKLFGVAFTLGGIVALIILITILFGNTGFLPIVGSDQVENLPTLIEILYPGDFQHNIIFISIMLVALIPVIGIISTGVKLLLDIRQTYRPLAIGVAITWLIGIAVLVVTGIELGMSHRSETEIEYVFEHNLDSTDVLTIDVMKDDIFSEHIVYDRVWNYTELIKVDKEKIHLGYPELVIREGDDSSDFEITLYKESCGLSSKDAIEKAENIDYKMKMKGNTLWLAPYFTIDRNDKLRGQIPTVEIKVPKNKKVKFGKNIDRIQVWISHGEYDQCKHHDYANTIWSYENEEFRCYELNNDQQHYNYHY